MRGISVVYYATLVVVGAGLTALLGFEIGWLVAHDWPLLLVAGVLVPWVLFLAWSVSEGQ